MVAAAVLATPLQIAFLLLAGILTQILNGLFPGFISFDWTSSLGIQGAALRFLEPWTLGILIYIANLLCYIALVAAKKVKLRYEQLCTLVVTVIILAIISARTSRGFFDFEQLFADTFLTSMTLFAVFTLSSVLLDKFSEMREWIKILLSFVLSVTIGSFLAFLLWTIF